MNKESLRDDLKRERKNLSREDISKKSRKIEKNLFTIDEFTEAKTVMVYFASFNEPRTVRIVNRLFEMGKRVVMPITDITKKHITPAEVYIDDEYITGAYGILEPKNIREIEKAEIDAALVPGIGFDKKGNRMGFGQGYYDRFLEDFKGLKIGMCYDFQVVDEIPAIKTDVPMDIIVTESGVINAI